MVDWSAANTPTLGADSIWIAEAGLRGPVKTRNIPTRSGAMAEISNLCHKAIERAERVLIGFDFGFGYSKGAAERISGKANWKALWRSIAEKVKDSDDNISNRFEVADHLNREAFSDGPMFWGYPHQHAGRYGELSARKPKGAGGVPERRMAERLVPSAQPMWKLAYTGSVGSQSLLGIARLYDLRERFESHMAVWPFETGFSDDLSRPITVAEIYPSLFSFSVRDGEVKDAAQVRHATEQMRMADACGALPIVLGAPADLTEEERETVIREEGWVVGAGTLDELYLYEREPSAIYAQSFSTIEAEVDLTAFDPDTRAVVVRLIHSCGMVDLVGDFDCSKGAAAAGIHALKDGAAIFCDVEMVRSGIIQRFLPTDNKVHCTLNDPLCNSRAKEIGNTRSAAGVDLWGHQLDGSVVVIGNAPTALFRTLERIRDKQLHPALIIGIPVGFVGALESKRALADNPFEIPYITVHGRRGGSAMASAALNALAARGGDQ